MSLYPYLDGTVEDVWAKNYYYDGSMTYPAREGYFNDWISLSECVGDYDNIIYRCILGGDTGEWCNEKMMLVPEIIGRGNRNPVVSPDETKVAFLSTFTTGTDTSPYLYIVPVDGGDPVKVSTDYVFEDTLIYTSFTSSFRSTFLLAWE